MPITPAQFGQTFTEGVKYIKLNKLDKNGLDNSNKLQQADSIIINYPDIGPQEYVIVSTQPQQDYYLLGLVNNPNTSSLNGVLDYSFLAISSSAFVLNSSDISNGAVSNFENRRVGGYGTIHGNSLNYFNTSSGILTFGNTPNKILQLQVSGTVNNNVDNTGDTLIVRVSTPTEFGRLQSLALSTGGQDFDFTFILTGSQYPIETNQIGIVVDSGLTTADADIISFNVSMSLYNSSPIPATSSLVTFTPEEDFYYSDYNPLFGNAEIPQFSNHFMDVDYTSNFTTPVNFDLIISGTADRAQISDSNYSSFAWSNIRYRGSKYNSYKI